MQLDPTDNMWMGRRGHDVKAIVLHSTEGSMMSALAWTHDPKSEASYHFIVGLDGTIIQTVDVKNTAWANGGVVKPTWKGIIPKVNPNLYTVSIARAGFAKDPMPRAQALAVIELIGELAMELNLTLNEETLVFHREIKSDKTCPGKVPNKSILIAGAQFYQALNRS